MSDEERKERIDEAAAAGVEDEAKASKEKAAAEAAEEKSDATADEPEAEEKPKPKRRRKKAEPRGQTPEDTSTEGSDPSGAEESERAKKEAADEEAEAEAGEADGEPPAEDEKARPKRRRGAAEVTAGSRKKSRRPARDEVVTVRAKAKYVRTAPRKARLVIDHIRGKSVDDARALLLTTPRAASRDVLKLLDSAIANAENNHELVADELVIGRAYVDEGPTLKRYRPRALGRATRIRKRTSHMTIELTNQIENAGGRRNGGGR